MSEPIAVVPFREAIRAWAYVALNSFGGPAGQIAVMHREIVERRGWIDEKRFLHALNYAMLLPGPEAQQLATYIGWLMHGVRGGLAAGILFVLPGAVVLMVLSVLYAGFGDVSLVQGLFYGIKPAVIAVVAAAVVRLSRRSLLTRAHVAIAIAAFVAIFFFDMPFPLIIIGAAVAGLVTQRHAKPASDEEPETDSDAEALARPSAPRSIGALLLGVGAWLAPTVALLVVLGPSSIFTQLALFFSFAAVITFGGAYAILAFVGQQAVDVYGWLTARQMVDGLGLAESTPGPLIMVVQFVAFLAAFATPTGLDPFLAGALAGLLVTWVTFVPSFTFIFAGAPYAEYIRSRPGPAAALSGISAAVTGVIANLAIWFSLQTLFAVTGELRHGPLRLHTVELASVDLFALGLAVISYIGLTRLRWPLLATLAASAAAGLVYFLLVGP
ncbi:MAG: chromate efflux transporter [Candidatus Limnocylindrales bacterium]